MNVELGRRTHNNEAAGERLVVFLIGMTFAKPWRVDAWLPTLLAMPRMLAELSRQPERGLLGYRSMISPRGPVVVQYWRDVDSLYNYAAAGDAVHRPAWTAFNRRARRVPGAVGIWHETFQVRAAETMYVDMRPFGLGAAVGTVPVSPRGDGARARLNGAS
jgi:hypothetical protein